ncbi:hypothetical protein HCN44_004718 [Aphidius gifuensis]|uniref:Uncharacterized protein n=1 Tax=Aphidius gifuensis TaxID=684658 RepID=A0A834XYL3_APHGI|nr:hypothetical protein HCN44_004718 [Aphidius gifuensis]
MKQKFYNVQHSAGSFKANKVGDEYYTASPGMIHYYNDMTFNCGNNKLYVLKNEDNTKSPILHNTLDVLHFDENNELNTISQINYIFDAATSISFDWTTKLLYWSERKNGEYSIKRTDESFEKTEYIIFPQAEPAIDSLEVYPNRGELFFASSDSIWYTSNLPSSTANLLFSPEQYPGWIYEITIDHATDKLYWVAGPRYLLHCVDIGTTARPFNEADIYKIEVLQIVESSPFNLAVFDNALYWMSYDEYCNQLQTTAQINDMFDAATSISFDWTTKLLYWAGREYGRCFIKRTHESFNETEYIIFPKVLPAIDGIEVYPKRGELFFSDGENICYTSNSPGSTANLLFSLEQYSGWTYEISIDYATDKLYWVALHGSEFVLHSVDIGNTARPFNEADIDKIEELEIVKNSPFNLAVFDDVLHWMSYDELNPYNLA